jgi:hypothetical protein
MIFTLKGKFDRENTSFKENFFLVNRFCAELFLELIKAVIDEKFLLRETQGR